MEYRPDACRSKFGTCFRWCISDIAIAYNNSQINYYVHFPPPNSQLLMSRLQISQVNSSINETVVSCADRETRISSSTVINVITDQTIAGNSYTIGARDSL